MTIRAKFPGRCKKCGQQIKVGDEIEWTKASGASHVHCPAAPAEVPDDTILISKGSGYGGRPYTVGQVVKDLETRRREPGEVLPGEDPKTINPYWVTIGYRYLVVLSASERYYRYDGMSFGVGDDRGYVYSARCRLATDEESAPLRAEEQAAENKKIAAARLAEIAETIRTTGEYPNASLGFVGGTSGFPSGDKIDIDTRHEIYGTWSRFIIGADYIWLLEGNGADGDDWSRNNLPGTIAHKVAYTAELDRAIRRAILCRETGETL